MESQGNHEFLLGIEEYLIGFGCKDQAANVHALANALSNENKKDTIVKTFLQKLGTTLGPNNRPLSDLCHKFVTAKEEYQYYDAVLFYITTQPSLPKELIDYIFKMIKFSNSMQNVYINSLKFILSKLDDDIDLKDYVFKLTKNTDETAEIQKHFLKYLLSQDKLTQETKDYIFKLTKDNENIPANTIRYCTNQESIDQESKDYLFKLVKIEQPEDAKLILLRYILNYEGVDQKLKDFIFKVVKPEQDKINSLLHFLSQILDKSMANLASALLKTTSDENFDDLFIKHHLIGLQNEFPSDKFFRGLTSCIKNNHLSQEVLNDAFSRSQIKSKFWLMKELSNIQRHYENVVVLAGWFGQIKSIYEKHMTYKKMRIVDLDKTSCEVSDYVFNLANLEEYKVKSVCTDINNLNLFKNGYEWTVENFKEPDKSYVEKFLPNLIINTSAEHMTEDWFHQIRFKKLDSDPIVAIQSNNMFDIEEHVNCVHSIEHMKKKFPMREVLYEGELQLKGYKRVMLIGRP